jgi:hypothetical protein
MNHTVGKTQMAEVWLGYARALFDSDTLDNGCDG